MQLPLRRALVAVLVVAALFIAVGTEWASAGEAGLVVEHGDGSVTYVLVVFPEDEISSLELLRRSGLSLTTVSSGGLGEAVCTLDNEGCGVSDCRTRLCQTGDPGSPFWKFFSSSDGESWALQPLGASSATVVPGEIDLWAWTGGDPTVVPLNLQQLTLLVEAPLARTDEGAWVAWFDASGNRIAAPEATSGDSNQLVTGLALIAVVGIAGFLMVRRRQADMTSTTGRRR